MGRTRSLIVCSLFRPLQVQAAELLAMKPGFTIGGTMREPQLWNLVS